MILAWTLFAACTSEPETDAVPEDTNAVLPSGGDSAADSGHHHNAVFENPLEATDIDPSEEIVRVELEAAPFTYEVNGETIQGWAYNGQVPGPTIRVPRGATLQVLLKNRMPDPTTIHWHGVHVPWNMDGVVWMGALVAPDSDDAFALLEIMASGANQEEVLKHIQANFGKKPPTLSPG